MKRLFPAGPARGSAGPLRPAGRRSPRRPLRRPSRRTKIRSDRTARDRGTRTRRAAPPVVSSVRRVEPFRLLDVPVAVARQRHAERAGQNQLVGRHPAKAGLGDERHHGVRHRAFGRPQPGRPAAEQPLVAGRRPFELLDGILGMHETLARHRRVGVRAQVHVGVAQQRQNRVIERRGRNLDLAALGGLPILRDDAVAAAPARLRAEQRLVLLGVAAPLLAPGRGSARRPRDRTDRSRRACATPADREGRRR